MRVILYVRPTKINIELCARIDFIRLRVNDKFVLHVLYGTGTVDTDITLLLRTPSRLPKNLKSATIAASYSTT
jgi:hypothetical protein